MPANYTPNYRLNQWEPEDKVLRADFNADNARTDGALKAEADARMAGDAALSAQVAKKAEQSALSALTDQVARLGNCRIETFTYTGTGQHGTDHPTVITFSAQPAFFAIFGGNGVGFGGGGRKNITIISYSNSQTTSFGCEPHSVTWSGNQMSLKTGFVDTQLNQSGQSYLVAAFYAEDAE